MIKLSKRASPLTVVSKRDDGSGGRVKMLLAVATNGLQVSNTAGGGDGSVDISPQMFQEIVENFPKKPGPVTLYFGHESEAPRTPETPAAGVIMDVWTEADGHELWGESDLGPKAWKLMVEERGFYGHSMEAAFNPVIGTGKLRGWALRGGSITNNPALDVQFLAASASEERRILFTTNLAREGKEDPEMEKTIETLQAENKNLELALTDGANKLSKAMARIGALEAQLRNTTGSNKEVRELRMELSRIKSQQMEEKVKQIILSGISAGKPAKFFDGWDTHDDGIGGWLDERFGGSVAALEASIARLEATPFAKATSSGRVGSEATVKLSDLQKAEIKASGGDPEKVEAELNR